MPLGAPVHQQTRPARRRRPNTIVAVAVTAAVTAVAVVAVLLVTMTRSMSEPEPVAVAGRVTLLDTDSTEQHMTWDPGTCAGEGKFADLAQGAQVVVKNLEGKTVGVGRLGHGVPGRFDEDEVGRRTAHQCVFAVLAPAVPAASAYRVQVGRQPETTVGRADLSQLRIRFGS